MNACAESVSLFRQYGFRADFMLQIGGLVFLFAAVFGGFMISGGSLEVILASLPHEMLTIGGAALAALLIGGSMSSVKKTFGEISKIVSGPKWRTGDFRDLLCLLFLLTKTMKSKGLIALEAHIEKPEDSSIFKRYPRIARDHFALAFICDTLRMMTMSLEDPHQVETAMEKQLEKHHHEALMASTALQGMAGRAAGAGHRRRGARRHQDHGLDQRAARGAGPHDRLGAGRHLHGRVPGLRHRRPHRHAAEGAGGGRGHVLPRDPRHPRRASARQRRAGFGRDRARQRALHRTAQLQGNEDALSAIPNDVG